MDSNQRGALCLIIRPTNTEMDNSSITHYILMETLVWYSDKFCSKRFIFKCRNVIFTFYEPAGAVILCANQDIHYAMSEVENEIGMREKAKKLLIASVQMLVLLSLLTHPIKSLIQFAKTVWEFTWKEHYHLQNHRTEMHCRYFTADLYMLVVNNK